MSRIGRQPITIPPQVKVEVEQNRVTVTGPKGQLTQEIHPDIRLHLEDGRLVVTRPTDQPRHRAMHGLTRTLLANMVEGVTQGFSKGLELSGVGYRAQLQGDRLMLSLGYSHSIEVKPPDGVSFEVEGTSRIRVKGIDKALVGQVAANIHSLRPPEPYRAKGVFYTGEVIRRKAGKGAKGSKGGKGGKR